MRYGLFTFTFIARQVFMCSEPVCKKPCESTDLHMLTLSEARGFFSEYTLLYKYLISQISVIVRIIGVG